MQCRAVQYRGHLKYAVEHFCDCCKSLEVWTTKQCLITALHCRVQQCATLHCTTLCYITLHYTVLHYTALHCTTLHYTVLHYTALHFTLLNFTAFHCTALHCTALYKTALKPKGRWDRSRTQFLPLAICLEEKWQETRWHFILLNLGKPSHIGTNMSSLPPGCRAGSLHIKNIEFCHRQKWSDPSTWMCIYLSLDYLKLLPLNKQKTSKFIWKVTVYVQQMYN